MVKNISFCRAEVGEIVLGNDTGARERGRDKKLEINCREVNQINCLVGYSTLGGMVKEIQYQKKKKRNCPHKRDESD